MASAARIRLTPLTNDDSGEMFSWINNRDLVVNSSAFRPVHHESHQEWFRAIQERADAVIFAIRPMGDERLIGYCQLFDVNCTHRSAELQIRIGSSDFRGKGHGKEAVNLLLKFGFADLNLNRVYLRVFATNSAALRVYERVGFVTEGVHRQAVYIDGGYVDVVAMGLLREEFR